MTCRVFSSILEISFGGAVKKLIISYFPIIIRYVLFSHHANPVRYTIRLLYVRVHVQGHWVRASQLRLLSASTRREHSTAPSYALFSGPSSWHAAVPPARQPSAWECLQLRAYKGQAEGSACTISSVASKQYFSLNSIIWNLPHIHIPVRDTNQHIYTYSTLCQLLLSSLSPQRPGSALRSHHLQPVADHHRASRSLHTAGRMEDESAGLATTRA